MDTALLELLSRRSDAPADGAGLCLGRVVHVAADGRAWVDFRGNSGGPVAARSVLTVPDRALAADAVVLLWLAPGEAAGPIIVGIVGEKLVAPAPAATQPATTPPPAAHAPPAESLVFEANREVVLRCGLSSLTLRKDGKVLLKGAAVVTHATGLNRIKGASVQIN